MQRVKFSEETVDKILSLRRQNVSMARIAKQLGCGYTTIYRYLGTKNVKADSRKNRMTSSGLSIAEIHMAIVKRYCEGRTLDELAEEFDRHYGSIFKLLSKSGFNVNKRKGKGAGRVIRGGYVAVGLTPNDPMLCMLRQDGRVLEHRLVMARYLGRPLFDWETVHHKDRHQRQNNDITNLQLRIGNHGPGAVYRCMDCGSYRLKPEEI